MDIPHELVAVVGLGVIGFVGSTVLAEVGQKTLSIWLNVVLYVGASVVVIKYLWEGLKEAAATFHLHF